MLGAAVVVVSLCWIVGNPRSAGPDEPSHMIAAAGLVRGDRDGEPMDGSTSLRIYEVPAMAGAPDPACWVLPPGLEFSGQVGVACADAEPLSTATVTKASRSGDYAPFAYLLPGVASFVPWAGGYAYLARLLDAAVPVLLTVWSLVLWSRRGGTGALAVLLGMTPIVWFTYGVVNPSAPAIGGGIALWTGLLLLPDAVEAARDRSTRPRWSAGALAVAGWVALVLPRRDGPVWATLIVTLLCVVLVRSPRSLLPALPRRGPAIVAVAVVASIVATALTRGSALDVALACSPVALLAVDAIWPGATALDPMARRSLLRVGVPVGLGLLFLTAAVVRPGGWEPGVIRAIFENSERHVVQWVGALGWIDAPMPLPVIVLSWAAVGGLLALAIVEHPPAARAGLVAIGTAFVVAWLLEIGTGSDSATYWQGRYTMPFAVGVPLVLSLRRGGTAPAVRRGPAIATAAWLVGVAGFATAQRRWGVGTAGSWMPWNWDTWDAVLPPLLLVIVHALALGAAVVAATPPSPAQR